MTSTERLELEIDLLEKRKQAVDYEQAYRLEEYNNSCGDTEYFPLLMKELNRDRAHLLVEIAEKKLTLYDLQGGPIVDTEIAQS
jgi:hypothetical protein